LIVKALNRVGRVVRRYAVTGRFRAAPGPIIARFFGGKECFFVNIGAYDGVLSDPLHRLVLENHQWRGIFVEPQAEPFRRLQDAYGYSDRFIFEQLAIADVAGERPFYSLSVDGMRETGVSGVFNVYGALDRDKVARELASAMRTYGSRAAKEPVAYLTSQLVRCEPIMSMLDRHGVRRIDVLKIDAEGDDFKIIQQIDYSRLKPRLILYEHDPGNVAARNFPHHPRL
jgi:FkbM family methyltransferase